MQSAIASAWEHLPQLRDKNAFDTGVSVLVSDSGEIVEMQEGCIPQVISRRMPGEEDAAAIAELEEQSFIRAEGWREALETAALAGYLPGNEAEMPFQTEYLDEPITRYPSQTVITAVYPCLHTIAQDEWVMIWQIDSKRQYADGCRF